MLICLAKGVQDSPGPLVVISTKSYLFDNVCHKSFLYKLFDINNIIICLFALKASGPCAIQYIIPSHHCYRWYSSLRASVRWQGSYSSVFIEYKCTRQGSILSLYFFF